MKTTSENSGSALWKRHKKIAVILVALVAYIFWAGFCGFDKYIREFKSLSDDSYDIYVHETYCPSGAFWVRENGRCYSSDPNVLIVNEQGVVLGVSPGTAYVVYFGNTGMCDLYRFTVSEVDANEKIPEKNIGNPKTHGSTASTKFESNLYVAIHRLNVLRTAFICLVLWLSFAIIHMAILSGRLSKHPTEENAVALTNMLKSRSRITKILIYSNMNRFGLRYDYLRELFNYKVMPTPEITQNTKAELHNQFKQLSVYGLIPVNHAPVDYSMAKQDTLQDVEIEKGD